MSTIEIPEPAGWEDSLTGLEGPDFWQRVLVAEVARAVRYKRSLTVVIAEVDGIEMMADTWGWNVGRHAIREAAQCLRRTHHVRTRIHTDHHTAQLHELAREHAVAAAEIEYVLTGLRCQQLHHRHAQVGDEAGIGGIARRIPGISAGVAHVRVEETGDSMLASRSSSQRPARFS